MAETKNTERQQAQRPAEKPENPRKAIREERERRLRVIDGPSKTIKVYAANEAMRRLLRHGSTRFKAALDQPAEWPNDSFTRRRINDGSVRIDGPAREAPGLVLDETLNPRQHAAVLTGARAIVDQVKETLRLTSLSPNTAVSGSADVVMSCIGIGFTSETIIQFGEHDEPTTLVSPTEVTTGVKPSLFAPAAVPVLVKNGSLSSEPLDFTFTAPADGTKAARSPPKSAA
jgi:hypothetical protein